MSKPITRKEEYLAAAAGDKVDYPAYPMTREEAYLQRIAKGGSVEANPEEEPTGTLESLKIGDEVYAVPSGGGGGGTSDYSALNNKPQINGVELAGNKTTEDLNLDYNDLKNKPTIPSAQIQSDWNQTDNTKPDFVKNKPSIPDDLADLNDDANHRTVTDTEKSTWNGKSNFSGNYEDLQNKPTIPDAQVQADWNQTNTDAVDYIKNKPNIPAAQIQSDWDQSDDTKADYIKNKPTLGTAAAKSVPTSGDAGSGEVVMGNDSRLSDSRPASDVSSWAKQATKPTYTASEVGAIPSTDKGANGGVATLGNDGIVPSNQLPTMFDGDYNSLNNKPTLGTAAAKNVPSAGNASLTEVVMGSDSRLSDDRNAKDVYSWAKAATKPTYTATEVGAIPSTDKGANGGVAELDSNGKVPSSQLPSYVDDVLSYSSQSAFPATGETGKIYIAEDTNKTYRWSGSAYAEISASLALGETSSTAYRGDRGKTAYDHSQLTSGNPHHVSKTDVGLGNVPNVSTNDQKPTFTEASTRNNIASGEKLSVIFGKIQKFFNDLKTVAFSGSYTDLSNKPSIPTKTSDLTNDSNFVSDANYVHTDNNFTASEKTKLAGIASGAEANVQANWSQTNTSADDFIKNKPSLATVATSGSYNDLSNKPTIPAAQVNSDWNASSGVAEILNKPSSYTPSSHKHGNIQNGGTLQTTDVAIANGDKLVVTDSSNSAKIARTSVAFDGTTTTQALSKKGTFETFSKFSGSYIDLTNKPQINSVELSGNKTTGDLGLQDKMQYSTMPTASADNEGKIYQYVGTTDANYTNGYYYKCVENSGSYSWQLEENIKEQTPTFSQASTRSNIASGEKLSVIMGKIQKFFNDLKSVAFSGSYTDLSDKPTIPTSASGISYDNTNSGLSATKVQGAVDELANFKMVILTNTTYLYSNGAAVKHGYTVTLTFSGFKGLTSHAITTLSGLVPQGMRPQTTVKCPIISPSASGITASEVYRIMVRSTGDIDIYPYNGVATQNNLEFSLTYVV